MLCVPDAEIAAAAAAVAGAAPLVGHTSGATSLSALEAAERAGAAVFGWHPLQTFAGGEAPASGAGATAARDAEPSPFAGAGCAIAGSTPAALAFAHELAVALGMTPFELDEDGRAAYHAAASIASNFLVTLQAAPSGWPPAPGSSRTRRGRCWRR